MSLNPQGIINAAGGGQLVSEPVFIGILWTGTFVSFGFVLFRIFVRMNVFRKLYADDYLVIGAWIFILISTIIWQTQQRVLYTFYTLLYEGILPDPEFTSSWGAFLKLNNTLLVLFYTSLWTVKLSFLLFFRRLGLKASVYGLTVWWWIVLGLSIAMWLTCIGDVPWDCSRGGEEQIFDVCGSQAKVTYEWTTLHYNCAVDVISDALIITIPMLLLWDVKMAVRQKLALLGLFSLTIVTMIFAVVRVAVVFTDQGSPSILWLGLWQIIQMSISVIIACVGSFRQLFIKQSDVPRNSYGKPLSSESDNLSFWHRGLLRFSRKSNSSESTMLDSREDKPKLAEGSNLQSSSSDHAISLPSHSIHVTDDYDVEFGSAETVLPKPFPAFMDPPGAKYHQKEKGNRSYEQIGGRV